jgi:hypothetical protein
MKDRKTMMTRGLISTMLRRKRARKKVMTWTENRKMKHPRMKETTHLSQRNLKTKFLLRNQLIRIIGRPRCFLKLKR